MNDSSPEASAEPVDTAQDADDAFDLDLAVEAALTTADRPVSDRRIADALDDAGHESTPGEVREAIERLNAVYEESGRSFRIEALAGGYQVVTQQQHGEIIRVLHRSRSDSRLSPAAMETLAIIAYKQPITRADIEAIRGVSSGEVIRGLLERHLVRITGRAEELGRPMLYGTTRSFLEVFGLSSLKDLPKAEELTAAARDTAD
ncbi:MAG: SMC-Scp complex subunit ScpB [Phycisphaeraceae bacterium]|nr:SMC-Scp complex subunit ScpB [Phycisphaeraceae bacterium]